MLTVNTQIPTLARGQIRALVKAHKDWRIFLDAKEIISADARNRDLLEFALFHPTLVAQIEQILQVYAAPRESAVEGKQTTFVDWLEQKLGTPYWVVAQRITPRLAAKGYMIAVSQKQFAALKAEWNMLAQIEQILDLPADAAAQSAFLAEAMSLLAILARGSKPRVRVKALRAIA